MIFVMVGTDTHDFSRLVKKVDEIAKSSKKEFIIQTGHTKYEPKNCKYFKFLPKEELEKYVKRADIMITHAGVGSIMTSLKYNKKPIVVPRRKEFSEHVNNHQLDLAKHLKEKNKIITIYDIDEIEGILNSKMGTKISEKKGNKPIIKVLNKFLRNLEGGIKT